jgi:hypothetical protein
VIIKTSRPGVVNWGAMPPAKLKVHLGKPLQARIFKCGPRAGGAGPEPAVAEGRPAGPKSLLLGIIIRKWQYK